MEETNNLKPDENGFEGRYDRFMELVLNEEYESAFDYAKQKENIEVYDHLKNSGLATIEQGKEKIDYEKIKAQYIDNLQQDSGGLELRIIRKDGQNISVPKDSPRLSGILGKNINISEDHTFNPPVLTCYFPDYDGSHGYTKDVIEKLAKSEYKIFRGEEK